MQDRETDVKKRDKQSHRVYIETLRRMTPEQRLLKAFELSEMARAVFRDGLRNRFPDLDD